jgi:hypothetical protein
MASVCPSVGNQIVRNVYRIKLLLLISLTLAPAEHCFAQQGGRPLALLDRLAGNWILSGTIGGQQTTHNIHAEWVLNREYLRLNEISAEKNSNGQPKYQAIIFIEWDPKRQEYACVWLDSTSGGGLSGPVGHAKPQPSSIPLVFTFSDVHTLRNTFTYNPDLSTWSSTITDVDHAKEHVFARVVLTRPRSAR